MRKKDTSDVLASVLAIVCDGGAVFGGFMLATWIRFTSELIPVTRGTPDSLYSMYAAGAGFATALFLLGFQSLGLFLRPQIGSFINKIPRLIKATFTGLLLTVVLAFAVKNTVGEFSSAVIVISFFTIVFFLLLERYILFRIEWNLARHSKAINKVLILGTNSAAAHVKRTLRKEKMLRSQTAGFLRIDSSEQADEDIPADQIKGTIEDLDAFLAENSIDQIILTSSSLGHERVLEIIFLCEQNLITFNMVPDLFQVMTSSMDVQSLDDIPLLGISRWPLDVFWNRLLKRVEDVIGSVIGLIVSAPVIMIAAVIIKKTSPGPVFFRQERCGEKGETFNLYKLRTMQVGAEKETGPVFAAEHDSRTTRVGAVLRRLNLDELPQLFNVLKGDMSLVGPRPERPHFVEKFKEDISRYMWRHVSKPGLTGWAQVNGLRGNTSIKDRIKYDLYYLENWSLAFDFKIILKTFIAGKNAY
ncbi:undecaprenyl-phosphate glucose phosphotransferase [Verrucomicrobiota bacterium]